jgi:hypothetical protein
MGYLTEFMIGSTIGFILYVFIVSISQTVTSTLEFNDRIQKIFIVKFLSALCLICLALTSFSYQGRFANRTVKWGLVLSSAALSINTMVVNWNILSDSTKIILIGLCLSVIVWYAYYLESKDEKDENEDDEQDGEQDGEQDDEQDDEEEYDKQYDRDDEKYNRYKRKRNINKFEDFIYNDDLIPHGMHSRMPPIDPNIFMRY